VVPTKVMKEAMAENTPYEKEYIEYVSEDITMERKKLTVISYTIGNDDSWEYGFDFEKEVLKPDKNIDYGWSWGVENQPTRCVLTHKFKGFLERLEKLAGKNYYKQSSDH
jgi:hypothetical protein